MYQLFNAEQLKRWDSLDEGYYVGELTEQVSDAWGAITNGRSGYCMLV